MQAFAQVKSLLPGWLQNQLESIAPGNQQKVQEIRLRTGHPPSVVIAGNARLCPGSILTPPGMEEVLFSLCGGSLYAHEQELAQGYVSLPGGHRAGVGGSYVRLDTGQTVLQQVQSFNIRIARSAAQELPPALCQLADSPFTGLLLAGEPGSGKTTLLRALALYFSAQGLQCTVIDERGEIFPPGTAQAAGCDCIRGLAKPQAIQMSLRTLAPQILLLDELVTRQEIRLLQAGTHAGVKLVFTIHAGSMAELLQKPQVHQMQMAHMLSAACVLAGRQRPGQIGEVKHWC